jgi:hypothetical protein
LSDRWLCELEAFAKQFAKWQSAREKPAGRIGNPSYGTHLSKFKMLDPDAANLYR